LSRRLPCDVRVRASLEAPPDFHARHSATARRYCYRLLDTEDVLWSRFAWNPPRPAPVAALERAALALEGEHDFSAFRGSGSSPGPARCRVLRAGWSRWEGGLQFDITADRFVYRMVRTIVGTSIALGDQPDPGASIARVLEGGDRRAAGPTAPPQGLCLEQVSYSS